MNELTKQFHNAEFDGWKPTKSYEETIENFWDSDLPFLEIDCDLDIEKIFKEVQKIKDEDWMETQTQTYQKEIHKKNGTDWFYTLHSSGWDEIRLKSYDFKNFKKIQKNSHDIPHQFDVVIKKNLLPKTIDELENKNYDYNFLKISRLKPSGWLHPHKDQISDFGNKLSYMWIPLNDCQKNLKIYPYGYMPCKLGCAYLLNNFDHIHSVLNKDQHDRYVILMKFNKSKIDMNVIKNAVKQQWYS